MTNHFLATYTAAYYSNAAGTEMILVVFLAVVLLWLVLLWLVL